MSASSMHSTNICFWDSLKNMKYPRHSCEYSVVPWGISVRNFGTVAADQGKIKYCFEIELWQGSWKEVVNFFSSFIY
jgi:hypothetical protein